MTDPCKRLPKPEPEARFGKIYYTVHAWFTSHSSLLLLLLHGFIIQGLNNLNFDGSWKVKQQSQRNSIRESLRRIHRWLWESKINSLL